MPNQDLTISIGLDTAPLAEDVSHAQGILGGLTDTFKSGLGLAAGIGIFELAKGAIDGIAESIQHVATQGIESLRQWREQLEPFQKNLGLSGEAASTFAVAMNHVGLSAQEGAMGLNIFTRGLAGLKDEAGAATEKTKLNADQIAKLRQSLDDANTRLDRAKEKLAEAKKPTDAMRWAVDDAQKAVDRLNTQLGNATQLVPAAAAKLSPFAKALQELGVNAFDAHGKLLTFDQIMPQVMDKFAKLPDGIQKSALAMDLFGARGGTKFIEFLNQGSAGLQKATAFAKTFGLSLSTDLSDKTEKLNFALNDTQMELQGFWVTLGSQLLPVFTDFVNFLNDELIPPLVDLANTYGPEIADVLGRVGNVFEGLFDLLSGKGTTTLDDFHDILYEALLGPLGEDGASKIADFVENALGTLDQLKNWFSGFLSAVQSGDWNTAWTFVANAVKNLWTQDIQPTLATWSTEFWDWLTGPNGAVSQATTKVQDFIKGAGDWLKNNGPATWTQLQTWATDFWDWLVGGNGQAGALGTVAANVYTIAQAIGSWLDTNWKTTIYPTLETWATDFWHWVTDKGGVLDNLDSNLNKIRDGIKTWSEATETQNSLMSSGHQIGYDLANAIGGGLLNALTNDPATKKQMTAGADQVPHDIEIMRAWENLGREFAVAIWNGIADWWKTDMGKRLQHDLIDPMIQALQGFNLGAGSAPQIAPPVAGLGTSGAGIGGGASGLLAGGSIGQPIIINNYIDSTPISNVVLGKAYGDIQKLFTDATAQAQASP